MPSSEICEWCKEDVKMMVQKGTGVCSQKCAKLASNILFDDEKKAKKFNGGFSGTKSKNARDFPLGA